ncbi:hypothetical protein H5410_046400 [Solanum commersonii]|uniref:Uncharacterized protein n=1 Tax=Solanum commersonii TaxID=4109 RepID=A0A9J5XFK1_SOLCO|nr:hypothetical protein H5410_046400 [Solanum commersonii]
MELLKVKMKEWSKENKGNWKQRKEDILSQIANWEIIQEHRMLTDDEILQKVNLAMEFEEIAKKEEIAWKQRSRVQWLKHGDKNTKFFHRIATSHKKFNTMEQLDIEDLFSICNNPETRVCESWTTQGWDISFRRLLNDWEVDRVASFLGKLGGTNLVTNAPDRVIWKYNKDGKFTVNSAYKKGIQVAVRGYHHHWKSIWRGLIPTKVKCFT